MDKIVVSARPTLHKVRFHWLLTFTSKLHRPFCAKLGWYRTTGSRFYHSWQDGLIKTSVLVALLDALLSLRSAKLLDSNGHEILNG
jgi:hypothetical protein